MAHSLLNQTINGKFRVLAELGSGGVGRVFRAEQQPLGRIVALKVLQNNNSSREFDPAFQRRFFLEASLCAKLSHPNIVTVFDYGRIETPSLDEDAYFMAMEYVEGETLQQRLHAQGGPLSPGDALAVTLEIARGLREAHRHGIVHRDLKPGNVMITPDSEQGERVKILDFGLVKQVSEDNQEDLTQENSFLGSPKYMSPEQIEHAALDHRTDLYALGVILYECLAGKVPFDESKPMQTLLAHLQKPVPAIRERAPGVEVPEELEALTRRLLEKSPEARVANADVLIRELRSLQAQLGLVSALPISPTTQTSHSLAVPIGEVLAVEPSNSLMGAARPVSQGQSTATGETAVPAPSRTVFFAAIALAFVALGTGMAVALRKPAVVIASAAPSTVEPDRGRAGLEARSHTLTIESTPDGATVSEGGRVLGTTPLRVALDEAQLSPRQFVLAFPGYASYVVRQPPTRESVRVVAALVPSEREAPAGSSSAAPGDDDGALAVVRNGAATPRPSIATPRPRQRPAATARPSAATSATRPDLDIRDER